MTDEFASIDTAIGNVNTNLDEAVAQLTQLSTQVAALEADTVTQEQLDEKAAAIQAVADRIGGLSTNIDAVIEPDPGEEADVPSSNSDDNLPPESTTPVEVDPATGAEHATGDAQGNPDFKG